MSAEGAAFVPQRSLRRAHRHAELAVAFRHPSALAHGFQKRRRDNVSVVHNERHAGSCRHAHVFANEASDLGAARRDGRVVDCSSPTRAVSGKSRTSLESSTTRCHVAPRSSHALTSACVPTAIRRRGPESTNRTSPDGACGARRRPSCWFRHNTATDSTRAVRSDVSSPDPFAGVGTRMLAAWPPSTRSGC